ncbi:MAG: DNA alkylation repair protein [Acidobacteria bacterium]|nr:DNA alkylation repair protein [Acidobacteriota bacterium]
METVKTLVAKAPHINLSKVDSKQLSDLEAKVVARVSALPEQKTDAIREVRREFSRRLAKAPSELIIRLALRLTRRRVMSLRFVAYELVQHHKPAFGSLNARSLEELGRGLDSWGAVDSFACYLAGPAWREQQISDASLRRWAGSKDRWWRRAALVSTVPLNSKARGGTGDQSRTVDICAMLVKDRDDMVVKALSWALRELAKRNPESVRQFLAEHEHDLAPRVLREVNNKLVSGLKNARRPRR